MTGSSSFIEKTFPPITRTTLALYSGASGDINAAHIDIDAARAAGFDDVFAQGMLVMAYMASAVTDNVAPHLLRSLSTRFVGITKLGDVLTCTGTTSEPFDENGERRVGIDLEIKDRAGEVKLAGRAVYALEAK